MADVLTGPAVSVGAAVPLILSHTARALCARLKMETSASQSREPVSTSASLLGFLILYQFSKQLPPLHFIWTD